MTELTRALLTSAVAALESDADLVRRVRAVLGLGPAADDVVHKDNCTTLGLTPRAFVDHARRGDFAAYKSGRRLVARREDVEAWIRSRRVHTPTTPRPLTPREEARAAVRAASERLRREAPAQR